MIKMNNIIIDPFKTIIMIGIIIIFFIGGASSIIGQDKSIAPHEDPTPFIRPSPFATLESNDAKKVLENIEMLVQDEGFKLTNLSEKEGRIEASKPDTSIPESDHRIIIWLERDFHNPQTGINIYIIYGRFMKIMSLSTSIKRVEVTTSEEEKFIGSLKQKLRKLAHDGGQIK
jgi:hypothetical protein